MSTMIAPKRALLSLGLGLCFCSTACDDPGFVAPIPEPPDAGCPAPEEPRHYEVYFVIDVSGSMEPFLRDVRDELEALAIGFPAEDAMGHGVRVDYYLVAFVNDVKVFGGRMSSPIALGAAFDEAITEGQTGTNLNSEVPNIDIEENLLDALAQIPQLSSGTATKLVMIATDAAFPQSPAILYSEIQVQSTYAQIYQSLKDLNARVHAFTRSTIPGLTVEFDGQPPLTTLTGSGIHDLSGLTGARDRVRERLNEIARGTACN